MRDADVTRIKEIQTGIRAMLAERASLIQPTAERTNGASAQVIAPSSYWSDFCTQFEYMLELATREFARLRNHTYHLTSDNYQTYYFGNPVVFRRLSCYDAIIAGLPARKQAAFSLCKRSRASSGLPARKQAVFLLCRRSRADSGLPEQK